MFGISFKTWQDICEMYFEIEDGSKKAYLQWFPFAKLTEKDEELLKSEAFTKIVRVVAAVIRQNGKIFATQRGYGEWKDGWEFPGGKIETGETPEEALRREIQEELDTEISVMEGNL